MPSVKVLLKTNQPKKDGTIPILIRVTIKGKVKYYSTGYAVKEFQFKPGSENWVTKHTDAVLINRAIEVKRSALAEKIYKADIDNQDIDMSLLTGKGKTFFSAVRTRLDMLEKRNQAGTFDRLTSRLNILKKAWGRDVNLNDLSANWVDKFITYRLSEGTAKSTIKKDLSLFSGVLKAVDYKGADYFALSQRTLKPDPVNRDKLSAEDIKLLETTKLYGFNAIARDMFLFSFYAHGMRFESVATFDVKTVKNGFIRYRMEKGKKIREIEVHSKLKKIIDRYKHNKPFLFPVLRKQITDIWEKKSLISSANTQVNTHLKRVAVICGIDKNLTMHIARHTFAYIALTKGVSRNVLKDALGHSSYAMTELYLKSLSDEQINEAVRSVYD